MKKENKTTGKLKGNMPTLIILIISGALIYALPYFRSYYYDSFVKLFNISNTQMGALGSAFGGASVFAYCLGGFCADRWPARGLMTISLIATGLCGFILLLYPPYGVVFMVHLVWGITSILTFWSALVKAIRSLADSDEQGKAFGFFEGGRGIVNMVQSAIILALFGYISKAVSEKAALSAIITIYSTICILLGAMVFFMFKEPERTDGVPEKLFNIPVLKRVAKMPTTWLQILVIFCSYAMIISYFYITPYATSAFGASAIIAAALGYFSQYCRPVGCFVSGILADKFGSSKICAISYVIMIAGIAGLIVTPGSPSMIWMILVFIAAIYASMYAIQSMHYAIMEEGDYPLEITGTATAIITPIGYSAEFFMPIIGGMCLDHWNNSETGYKVFFGILGALALIGLIAILAWMVITKEKRMQIMAEKNNGKE